MIPIPYPCWRWSAACPEGRVFNTAEDLAAAPGVWVDSPALLVQKDHDPTAEVAVSGIVTDSHARKRARKTDADAETTALIAQLEEFKK